VSTQALSNTDYGVHHPSLVPDTSGTPAFATLNPFRQNTEDMYALEPQSIERSSHPQAEYRNPNNASSSAFTDNPESSGIAPSASERGEPPTDQQWPVFMTSFDTSGSPRQVQFSEVHNSEMEFAEGASSGHIPDIVSLDAFIVSPVESDASEFDQLM